MNSFITTKLDGTTFDLFDKNIPSTILSGSQNCSLLSEDTLTIQTKSAQSLPVSIGDKCTIYGKKYIVNIQPSVKKQGPRKFITDIVFEGVQYELLDAQFLLPDNTIGDSLTGNLYDFLQILIGNADRVGIWSIGDYPDNTEYKTLTLTGENCLSALQRFCEEWGLEFEIEQSGETNILHIRTAGVDFPYTFKYGSTGGLYELTRKNINSENVVTRLYVYGGSNNLGNGYLTAHGCGKLCLPGKNKNSSFIQDTTAIQNYGLKENTKIFDDIFPKRYGTVTELGEDYLSFIDDTMSFDLNEKEENGTDTKWLIPGVSAKVHFNTGNLAGYEFELESYNHESKTFKLIPFEDENGMKFPNPDSEGFRIGNGNEYFFIDIRLPQSYIDEAEEKLKSEAEAYYTQNSNPRVSYELSIHDIFFKQFASQVTIANLFAVGDYVPVQDSDIGVNKSIRITGFKRDILKPYKYDITLGEAITKTTITRLIKDQRSIEEIIRINNLNDPSRARRNWRSSQEVLSMVFDPEGDYFSEKIKPLSIETTMLQSGAKSTQFILSNVVFEPNYQGDPNVIKVGGGQLIHYTIEDTTKIWDIATKTVSGLDSNTPYYIYVRCSKSENAGSIIIDTVQRKVDYEDGYYTFMVGVLNSVETDSDGSNPGRLVSLTYGSSTINGRFIKTGRIESSGGSGSFFDLDDNEFRIGNENRGLLWNINNDGRLVLKGTLVQSESGDEQPLGCFRGPYNSSYTYYKGDEVVYEGSMYRFIYDTPQAGKMPTDTTYWTILAAKGEPGENGEASDWKTFAYKKSATKPASPTDTTSIPSGWKDYPDSEVTGDDKWWMVVAIVHWTGSEWIAGAFVNNTFVPGQWSEPITVTGEQGTDGQYVDFKFYATTNLNSPTWNATLASMLNPTGWLDQPPQLPVSGAIWMIEAWKQAGGTQLITTWSTPARISGEKGQDGTNGSYKSFVFKKADTQPTAPTGTAPIPSGWVDAPTTSGSGGLTSITHGTTWALQADGTYKSPTIDHSGITKNRITFTTTGTNSTIQIYMKVSSEANYDWALVGLLDNGNLTISSNYTDRISGTAEKTISINVPAAGTHYIDIGYAKDSSAVGGSDCAWYKVLTEVTSGDGTWWMSSATVSYTSGQWVAGTWSAPVKVTGEDGAPGADGKYWDYRYAVNATQPSTPSGLQPSGWSNTPPSVTSGTFLWMSFCEKNADGTSILQAWSTPVRISGEKGQDGADGAYFEYRYAKNGSTTSPPTLPSLSTNPSGWATIVPPVGDLEYLWMTVAKKSAAGVLLGNWNTPVRLSGVKGDTGSSPALVFRGIYDSTATYYGTNTRVDAVKYNSTYYVARTDAGNGFTNKLPTNTDYWNSFGASFDSVATNLLLAENANIADWIIKSGKITSQNVTTDGTPRAQLDGANGGISFASDIDTYTASGGTQKVKQSLKIDSVAGQFTASSSNDAIYVSSQGIYANKAGQQAIPSSSGIELKAAIAGIGQGNLQKDAYSSVGCIAGVFGRASNSNSNPAPAYGGYFLNLLANGLYLSCKRIDSATTATENDVYFSCYNTTTITLTLPVPQAAGKIYFIRINNASTVNITASGGKTILKLDGTTTTTFAAAGRGELIIMMWDGQYWLFSTTNM
jgi:hypothetical protein